PPRGAAPATHAPPPGGGVAPRAPPRHPPPPPPPPAPPAAPPRGDPPLQRRLEPAVEPLHAAGLEVRAPRRGRVDREARVLERPHDSLPRLLGGRGVGVDQLERRAHGQRLPQPHPRPPTPRLAGPGARAHQPPGPPPP